MLNTLNFKIKTTRLGHNRQLVPPLHVGVFLYLISLKYSGGGLFTSIIKQKPWCNRLLRSTHPSIYLLPLPPPILADRPSRIQFLFLAIIIIIPQQMVPIGILLADLPRSSPKGTTQSTIIRFKQSIGKCYGNYSIFRIVCIV